MQIQKNTQTSLLNKRHDITNCTCMHTRARARAHTHRHTHINVHSTLLRIKSQSVVHLCATTYVEQWRCVFKQTGHPYLSVKNSLAHTHTHVVYYVRHTAVQSIYKKKNQCFLHLHIHQTANIYLQLRSPSCILSNILLCNISTDSTSVSYSLS